MNELSKKQQIVAAADLLFYHQGYEYTSFSHIAEVVKISRGNFYYHFKAKDQILDAVINLRLANTHKLLKSWEASSDQAENRIRSFIDILIVNANDIMLYGCPVGTLNAELAKLNHQSKSAANMLFTLFRTWLRRQFSALGQKVDADLLAMHLIAHSQGVATMASTFSDEKFVRTEVQHMHDWLQTYVDSSAKAFS